jgi:hypothetical protein
MFTHLGNVLKMVGGFLQIFHYKSFSGKPHGSKKLILVPQ